MVQGSQEQTRGYQKRINKHKPRPPLLRNVLAAFLMGGTITGLSQLIFDRFLQQGMTIAEAATPTAAIMIAIGALLTGVGVYDRLGNWGGMGAALPITGFANAIVAPALEFKREGYVMGVGAQLFSIAGPVIVYAVTVATISGAIRYYWVGP
ncbi:MAG: SpoVA/SpoVAEb family sporulation membrane protein [Thermaerobacterales bacterium]